jgi:hypothetical protein
MPIPLYKGVGGNPGGLTVINKKILLYGETDDRKNDIPFSVE